MAEDAAWQAAERAVGDAESQAAAADAKARQAETDRDEKRRPYEADPLFMYLWNTGYGTPAYRAGTIVRLVDGKVAALVGYQTARANYHMLREIPERLREHAERLRSAVAEAVTVREAIEREALERDGILPLEAAEQAAEEALAAADADLAKARSDLEAMDQQLRGLLDESSDPALAGALDDLAATIAREDLRTLYRQAMATPTAEDDTIIKQLQETERALVRVTAEAEEVRRTAVELASRRAELERSEESFRRGGYDDPFGEFQDGAIIGTVLEGILRGALSSRHLEEALGKGYRRRQPRSGGGFGGGLRLPSGGRSGGGFRTGGRSGGGGFRTGGRF